MDKAKRLNLPTVNHALSILEKVPIGIPLKAKDANLAPLPDQDGKADEERGEGLTSGAKDFDHPNREALEAFVPPTLNLEHITQGNTPAKEVPIKKADLDIIIQMGLIGIGTPTAEDRILAKSAQFVGDSMIDLSRDGFNAKVGISTVEYNIASDTTKKGGGFFNRVRHPFGGGQPQQQQAGPQ